MASFLQFMPNPLLPSSHRATEKTMQMSGQATELLPSSLPFRMLPALAVSGLQSTGYPKLWPD